MAPSSRGGWRPRSRPGAIPLVVHFRLDGEREDGAVGLAGAAPLHPGRRTGRHRAGHLGEREEVAPRAPLGLAVHDDAGAVDQADGLPVHRGDAVLELDAGPAGALVAGPVVIVVAAVVVVAVAATAAAAPARASVIVGGAV